MFESIFSSESMVTSKHRERIVWSVVTFFSVFTALWTTQGDLGIVSQWIQAIITAVVSIAIVLFVYFFLYLRTRSFQSFVGYTKGQEINLVVSAYKDTRPWQKNLPLNQLLRYYKEIQEEDGRIVQKTLIGAHDYLTGIETTKVISDFVYRLREIGDFKIKISRDGEDCPPGPVICFGSPTSNFSSDKFLSQVNCKFENYELRCNLGFQVFQLKSSDSTDIGILVRQRLSNDSNSSWGFVCAGIDEEGTVAAATYFLAKWETLSKYKGSFVHVVSCEKNNPFTPMKEAGWYRTSDGWIAD